MMTSSPSIRDAFMKGFWQGFMGFTRIFDAPYAKQKPSVKLTLVPQLNAQGQHEGIRIVKTVRSTDA